MTIEFFQTYLPLYFRGSAYTLALSFCAIILGIIVGTLLALMKLSPSGWLNRPAHWYIQIVRGTPLLVQLYLIYYGLFVIGIEIPNFASGVVAVALNSAAYIAEIIRAGIQAVDKGQMEAARSIGMNKRMAMQKIIYPQAIKNILPAMGNEFATLIKETSIVSILGLSDLMFNSQIVSGATFKPFLPLFIAAVFYFVMTTIVSKLVERLERRLKESD